MRLPDKKREELFNRTTGALGALECVREMLQSSADVFRNPMELTEADYTNFLQKVQNAKTVINEFSTNAITELDSVVIDFYTEMEAIHK